MINAPTGTSNEENILFENYAYVDNTEPTATITYTNVRDPLLTHTSSSADSTYCCFAIGGDQITVQVTMNEKIKGINPIPLLSGTYNKDNDGVGSVFSDISPSSYNLNDDTGYADTLNFTITIEDGESNDGILELDLIAFDRSGTQVALYDDSPQKISAVSSNIALEIDNIHPWGYTSSNEIVAGSFQLFEDPQPEEVTFPTDSLWTTGYRVVDGWINALTDSLKVKIPYHQFASDSTLYGSQLEPAGKLDVQVKNLDIIPVQWQNVGDSDDLVASGSGIEFLGDHGYLRTVSRSIASLDTALYSIGNRLLFRGMLTDKHGNVTYGQTSDMYLRNDRDFYELDSLNADTVRYDIIVPSIGDWNGGNFSEGGPIVSLSLIHI